jgi:cytochrome c biogenesis protein ResB
MVRIVALVYRVENLDAIFTVDVEEFQDMTKLKDLSRKNDFNVNKFQETCVVAELGQSSKWGANP